MRKSESVKKPKRVRVGSLFTLENDAKSELKRRAKASGVPMSRILDSLVLNRDRLSDEAERVLTQYCADHGISRPVAPPQSLICPSFTPVMAFRHGFFRV